MNNGRSKRNKYFIKLHKYYIVVLNYLFKLSITLRTNAEALYFHLKIKMLIIGW